jgi:nucleotide-binding universal stress UspA family protein
MASWWELAIPAASAIAGSVVTSIIQSISVRSQRRHEREMHFLDSKRIAYVQFLTSWESYTLLGKEAVAIKQVQNSMDEQLRNAGTKIDALKQQGNASAEEISVAEAERKKALKGLEEFKKMLEAFSTKFDSIKAESHEYYFNLRILAPATVRDYADNMFDKELILSGDDVILEERRQAFEEAVRKDLG